jgi:hypothetical protein
LTQKKVLLPLKPFALLHLYRELGLSPLTVPISVLLAADRFLLSPPLLTVLSTNSDCLDMDEVLVKQQLTKSRRDVRRLFQPGKITCI